MTTEEARKAILQKLVEQDYAKNPDFFPGTLISRLVEEATPPVSYSAGPGAMVIRSADSQIKLKNELTRAIYDACWELVTERVLRPEYAYSLSQNNSNSVFSVTQRATQDGLPGS